MHISKVVKEETACFIGQGLAMTPWLADKEDPRYIALQRAVRELMERAISRGYRVFLCGLQRGFEMISAEVALELKEKYPEIQVIGVMPSLHMEEKWESADQVRFRNIINKLDNVHYISYGIIGWICYLETDKERIRRSSLVIALYNGSPFGITKEEIDYAKEQGVEIKII